MPYLWEKRFSFLILCYFLSFLYVSERWDAFAVVHHGEGFLPRPLKVAYLHFSLQPGGVERHILNIVRLVDPARVVPTVVLTRGNASTALLRDVSTYAEVVYFPAQIKRLEHHDSNPGDVRRDPAGFSALVAYLKRSSFDVAFSFYCGGQDDMVGLDAAALAGVPVSIAYVGWTVKVPPGLPIDALELPSDRLMAIQRANAGRSVLEESASPYTTVDGYKLARINSPIDMVTSFSPSAVRKRLGPKPRVRSIVVGRISRLVMVKNPQTFIIVAAAVRRMIHEKIRKGDEDAHRVPSVLLEPRFLLAGEGPLRADLEAMAEEYGVRDLVEFVVSLAFV